jgi:hypothetical protein
MGGVLILASALGGARLRRHHQPLRCSRRARATERGVVGRLLKVTGRTPRARSWPGSSSSPRAITALYAGTTYDALLDSVLHNSSRSRLAHSVATCGRPPANHRRPRRPGHRSSDDHWATCGISPTSRVTRALPTCSSRRRRASGLPSRAPRWRRRASASGSTPIPRRCS